jgi:tetratricopeptide (TPR) repeat protein
MENKKLLIGLFVFGFLLLNVQRGWCQLTKTPSAQEFKKAGDFYLKQGEINQAKTSYQKTLELNPRSTSTYFNLAIAYYSEKDIDRAASALEKLLQLDPNDAEAHYNLACLRLYQHRLDKAKKEFEAAKKLSLGNQRFASFISQGLEFLRDLNRTDRQTQDLILFLTQLQQGLNPSAVLL